MRNLTAQQVSQPGSALRAAALALSLAALALSLGGCGSSKPQPAPLERFQPVSRLAVTWSQRVAEAGVPTSLAVATNTVAVSGVGGEVAQFALDSGKPIWRATSASLCLPGREAMGALPPSSPPRTIWWCSIARAVWRERQPGRVITAPLVAGERVFVQGVDRAVRAYDVRDGRWLWQYQRPGANRWRSRRRAC